MNNKLNIFKWKVIYVLTLILFIGFSLGPILWSFIISITPNSEFQSTSAPLIPSSPTFDNYSQLLFEQAGTGHMFRTALLNSTYASFLTVLIGIPLAVFGAYPLARLKFKGKNLIKNLILVTLVIPVFAVIIPLFKMFTTFKLMDTYSGLTLVYISGILPLTTWTIISFFETLPRELEEAAQVDGCSGIRMVLQIFIPISYPIIFAATLISFLGTWNQFLVPLVLAPSNYTKPIAVIITEFVTKNMVKYGLMNAGGMLALLPPAILAIIFKRSLVAGLTGGATKG